MTVTTLRSLWSDSNYKLFWAKVTSTAAQLGVHEAQIPHRRKAPKRYEQGGTDSPHFPTTVEEFYRQIYPEALDKICTCITRRFDQPEYHTYMYHNIQELLLKAARKEDYLTELIFCNRILQFWSKPSSTHHTTTSNLRNFTTVHLTIVDIIKFLKDLITSPAEISFRDLYNSSLNYSSKWLPRMLSVSVH